MGAIKGYTKTLSVAATAAGPLLLAAGGNSFGRVLLLCAIAPFALGVASLQGTAPR